MTDRELMQQALNKLEFFAHMKSVSEDTRRLITALRERLAQPEQGPVDSAEKASMYMDARLWEFIDMAASWPEAKTDLRTWGHVMVYAPKPAWRAHVEQRLRTWRQSFVNRSGDQLALDDFMDKRSLDDLIDFVCDEYTDPQPVKFNCTVVDDAHPEGVPLNQWGKQQKQKPFCYHDGRNIVGKEYADHSDVFPLYTEPQPEHEPLTEKRISELYSFWVVDCQDIVGFARAIERLNLGAA